LNTILYCHHYSEISGGETSLLELFRNLDRNRFRPILAAPGSGPFAEAARALGVEVFPVEYGKLRRVGLLAKTALRLREIARENGAALLHANGPVTNVPAALAARLSGLPVVWHARTLPVPGEIDLDRLLSSLTSLIIANSDAIRDRFRGRSEDKSMTIINGVDTGRFHPGAPEGSVRQELGLGPGDVMAGVVGRIAPIKGQRAFIEAAAALIPRHPDLRFIIVGAGLFEKEKAHEDELRRLVAEQNLEKRIFFTGYQRDICPYLAAMDICAVPSESEGCSRVLFEAMALAKPVVATDTGGTPEVVEDGATGLLIPVRDTDALAAAIETLAGDEALRIKMGAAGRRRVEKNFTIESHARKTERAYMQLLGGTNGNG
jgi:glycosyltransferase involved in cell wall biosynthesis